MKKVETHEFKMKEIKKTPKKSKWEKVENAKK